MKSSSCILFFVLFPLSLGAQICDEDTIGAEVIADTVIVYHLNAEYHCGSVIEYEIIENDFLIDILEIETWPDGPGYCMCCYDLGIYLVGLAPGTYHIRVWNEDMTELYGEVWVTVGSQAINEEVSFYQSECFWGSNICGDANGDGSTTASDALYILTWLIGGPPPPSCRFANVNGDNALTASDAFTILNYLSGQAELTCSFCSM